MIIFSHIRMFLGGCMITIILCRTRTTPVSNQGTGAEATCATSFRLYILLHSLAYFASMKYLKYKSITLLSIERMGAEPTVCQSNCHFAKRVNLKVSSLIPHPAPFFFNRCELNQLVVMGYFGPRVGETESLAQFLKITSQITCW